LWKPNRCSKYIAQLKKDDYFFVKILKTETEKHNNNERWSCCRLLKWLRSDWTTCIVECNELRIQVLGFWLKMYGYVTNQGWPAQCASMKSRDKSIGMSSSVGEGTRPPPSYFIFMHLPKLWYSSYFLQWLRRVPLNFFRTTSLGTSAQYHADDQTWKYKLKTWNYMVNGIEITEDTRGSLAEPRVTDVGGLGITTHK